VIIDAIRILPLPKTPSRPCREGDPLPGDNLYTLIEVVSDQGLTGLGSVYTSARLVQGSLEVLERHLIGQSATEPARVSEMLHQTTFAQGRGGAITHTISGIDIALWDMAGKAAGQSVSRLLGGRFHDRLKPYASLSMSHPEWLDRLSEALRRGFKAVKIGWGAFGRVSRDRDESLVRSARERVGPDVELMVDAGGSAAFWPHGYKWALRTSEMLAAYNVTWFEEPLPPDDIAGYALLTENAPLPIASCEVLTRRQAFAPWIERRAVDVVQPDTTKVGGLTEAHTIGTSACEHGLRLVPHGWNTAVGLAADLHLVASLPNGRWVEYLVPTPFIDELVAEPFSLDADGYLQVPEAPGLGIPWNPDAILKYTGRPLTPSAL
jgi:D-galactarolactone cycloisomerase